MNSFTVYVHINKINGKRYVGITSQVPEARWQNGMGYKRNKHFSDAIARYGWDSFEHVIVVDNVTKDVAVALERSLITEYKTQDKHYGYNITDGGEHFKHSSESRSLMSQRRAGKGRGPFSPEHIARIKKNHKGGADGRLVRCIETGEVFPSINDAARAKGTNKKGVSGCCRKVEHYNTAGGLHWEFV